MLKPYALVYFGSALDLVEIGKRLSREIFGGIQFHICEYEDMAVCVLESDFLGLKVELAQSITGSQDFRLEIKSRAPGTWESTDASWKEFEALLEGKSSPSPPTEPYHDCLLMGEYVGFLLQRVDGINSISIAW